MLVGVQGNGFVWLGLACSDAWLQTCLYDLWTAPASGAVLEDVESRRRGQHSIILFSCAYCSARSGRESTSEASHGKHGTGVGAWSMSWRKSN